MQTNTYELACLSHKHIFKTNQRTKVFSFVLSESTQRVVYSYYHEQQALSLSMGLRGQADILHAYAYTYYIYMGVYTQILVDNTNIDNIYLVYIGK